MKLEYDVIIVGFGLAGAVAGAASAQCGARTLVVDMGTLSTSGGNSLVSGQGVMSTDDIPSFLRYMSALGVRPPQPHKWAESVSEVPEMLSYLGVALRPSEAGGDFKDAPGWAAVQRWRPTDSASLPMVRVVQNHALALGVDVALRSRVVGLQYHAGRSVDVTFSRYLRRHTVRARHGVVLACGGYAASSLVRSSASLGTPFARGDGIRLAAHLGANIPERGSVSGPYYGFQIPGTCTALTPQPLYGLRPSRDPNALPRLISRASGRTITPPPARLHGHQRDPDGRYRRASFPPATLLVSEADLARGPLVPRWPDGHAEGWGRRFEVPWSDTNEREIALGWMSPLSDEQRSAVGLRRSMTTFAMHVEPVLLNSLGGLRCDESFAVLSRDGTVPGLYAAGELASWFRSRYQGSANLAECVISGSQAATSALGRKEFRTRA